MFIKRVQKKFFEQNPHINPEQHNKKGKVTIQRVKDKRNKDIPPDLGEYIDYEDVNTNENPKDE